MTNINNELITKNTFFLYVRMIVTMSISLYSSRVILDVLGFEDFGLYIVIGGLVGLFSFFSASIQSGIQRFLAFELGKNNYLRYNQFFNVSLVLFILLAFLIAILAETLGLWYLLNELNIPAGRESSAVIVFHFTVLSICISILRIPFMAGILAQEKMSFFAYVSILEAILKLLAVFLLVIGNFDKIILHSILIFSITLLINLAFMFYCFKDINKLYEFKLCRNIKLYLQLFSFSNWRLLGACAQMTEREGVALMLNNFFGVLVNASNGIAMQINIAVSGLVSSFQQAFMPQITKSYAIGDLKSLEILSNRSAKISFMMVAIFTIPLILNMEYVLDIWLVSVPEYASQFSTIILLTTLVESISAPLWMIILATGRIAFYQICLAAIIFFSVVCDYFLLKFGYPPVSVLYVFFITTLVTVFFRLILLRIYYGIKMNNYLKDAVLKPTSVTLAFLFLLNFCISGFENFEKLSISAITALTVFPALMYLIVFDKSEKQMLVNFYSRTFQK